MKDYKNTEAPISTITFDKTKIEEPTQNIYKAIAIMAKRASQVNEDLKSELVDKLEEFATFNDSLEEVFENKEQIEVSRFYERLPKPTAIAVQEWLDEEIYFRDPEENNEKLD
ncbi:MAG: DNA-directed RNA polymerase subunit omega [Flavobacteriaceae bacterium]|nr:DNA-directed RNA polymerase subunit omega [Flavobacteriaceae bacterium]